jgi:hypothetical protein
LEIDMRSFVLNVSTIWNIAVGFSTLGVWGLVLLCF